MTVRNIKKSLVAMEDIAQGKGEVSQTRAGAATTVHKVDVPFALDTTVEMSALDITKYTRARVYSDTVTYLDYIYDEADLTGIVSDTGPGTWVLADSGDTTPAKLINDLSQAYTFKTVALMRSSLIVFPVGKKIFWQGYHAESDGGGNWGIVKSGAHTDDGGSQFTLNNGDYVQANLRGKSVSVLKFGAGLGLADDSSKFQRVFDLAKGDDVTSLGRSIFNVYIPNPSNFYRIENTIVIDGTHGIKIHGDGALKQRSGNPNPVNEAAIRWYGSTSLPMIQIKGQTETLSNPNFLINIKDLTLTGYQSTLDPTVAPPSNIALSCIHIGEIDGGTDRTLARMCNLENVEMTASRFGIWSGSTAGVNTDHATISMTRCYIHGNAQSGIRWGTGNAIAALNSCFVYHNGWGALHFPADSYSEQKGANVHCVAGYMDFTSYVSAGLGDYTPVSADILQSNGRVSITGAWSDTHGVFYKQDAATTSDSAYQPSMLTGIRHFEGSMNDTNTPTSMEIRVKGTAIQGIVRGDIALISGLAGSPVDLGVNFGAGKGYTGTGVNTQRSLVRLSNSGNEAQTLWGGADSGVDLKHVGALNPQHLHMGVHSAGDSQSRAVRQVLGGAAGDSGFTEFVNAGNGESVMLINGYISNASTFEVTPMAAGLVFYIARGGAAGLKIRYKYSADGTTPFTVSSMKVSFEARNGPGVFGDQAAIAYPQAGSDPTYNVGDFWEGCCYYNSTSNKLRLNTGGSTWVDLN